MDQEKYCSGEKQHGVRLYRKDGAGEIRAGKLAAGKFRESVCCYEFPNVTAGLLHAVSTE
jgi:hypothetical protein